MAKKCGKTGSNRATLVGRWEEISPALLKSAKRRTRKHPRIKRAALQRSIEDSGIVSPIIINKDNVIVDGHLRVELAIAVALNTVPVIRVEHMSEAELKAYGIAANKMPADVDWDVDAIRLELEEIIADEPLFDLSVTGITIGEIDRINGNYQAGLYDDLEEDGSANTAQAPAEPRTRVGDLWRLGHHLLLCGDATDPHLVRRLMGDAKADAAFVDPPYNVRINGHVSKAGRHAEFHEASGEMTPEEYAEFLNRSIDCLYDALRDRAVAFICMDHAHIPELCEAANNFFERRLNICVWDKGQGGMGSLYRSQHEFVAVFKKGTSPHTNNVKLGKNGRNRTNVWSFPGMAGFGKGRAKALELHPTVKPVALVAEALLDVTAPGDLVLDTFGGSGTTLIAAERIGRVARLVEIDPIYVDRIIARWERMTGQQAELIERGERAPDASTCPNSPNPETE